jgi:uncharacterized membrane protein YesL
MTGVWYYILLILVRTLVEYESETRDNLRNPMLYGFISVLKVADVRTVMMTSVTF